MSFISIHSTFDTAPLLAEAFVLSSMRDEQQDTFLTSNTGHSADDINGAESASALNGMNYDRLSLNRYERIMANIESMMNAYDYKAAAQELVNINIGELPLCVFERFSNALDKTSLHMMDSDTYLNAQLAAQSLTVFAVQDTMEQSAAFFTKESASLPISLNAMMEHMDFDNTPSSEYMASETLKIHHAAAQPQYHYDPRPF